MAVRSKDFASLCRKIQSMKQRVNEIAVAPAKGVKAAPERSSVGLIDSPDEEENDLSDVG